MSANGSRDDVRRREKRQQLIERLVVQVGDSLIKDSGNRLAWRDGVNKAKAAILANYEVRRAEAEALLQQPAAIKKIGKVVDRHKVAAAVLLSILDSQPLEPIFGGLEPYKDKKITLCFFPNQVLAFKSAIEVMVRWLRSDYRTKEDFVACLKQPFDYPTSSEGAYQEHVYKALFLAKMSGGLNLLVLANLLFMLENHNLNAKQLKKYGVQPGLRPWVA